MKVLIAAGGTGGHVFPALALALEFSQKSIETTVAGSINPDLRDVFRRSGILFREMPAIRLPAGKIQWLAFPFRAVFAFIAALVYLLRQRPSAVIGMGGYASAAPAAAAIFLGTPLFFCEQNLLPGKVTRFFSRFCRAVFVSFPDSRKYLPTSTVLVTGNPLRPFPGTGDRRSARRKLDLDEARFTVLVLGGSQGAHKLNLKLIEALDYLPPDNIQFIHLTGTNDYRLVADNYQRKGFRNYTQPFRAEMEILYQAADLAVCRAGATTIAEITLFRLPSILVPFPFAAEDHQKLNALYLAERQAALVKEEAELTGENLAGEIKALAGDPARTRLMSESAGRLAHPDAGLQIVAEVLKIL